MTDLSKRLEAKLFIVKLESQFLGDIASYDYENTAPSYKTFLVW